MFGEAYAPKIKTTGYLGSFRVKILKSILATYLSGLKTRFLYANHCKSRHKRAIGNENYGFYHTDGCTLSDVYMYKLRDAQ